MILSPYQSRRWCPAVCLEGQTKPSGIIRTTADGWERAGALRQLYDLIRAGQRRIVLVMPTGAGKTVVALELIRDCLVRGDGWRVLFVVDRIDLVDQTIRTLEQLPVPIGWIWRGLNADPTSPLQVASVQSLEAGHGAWVREWIGAPKTLIILDEAHKTAFRTSIQPWLRDASSQSIIVGLTATPDSRQRLMELGDLFEGLAVGPTYRELIEVPDERVILSYAVAGYPGTQLGSLVPTEYIPMTPEIDPSRARVGSDGEWNEGDLAVPAMDPIILSAVVRGWEERCAGLRSVGFCCTVEHALRQGIEFARRGWRAGLLVGDPTRTGWIRSSGELQRAPRSELNQALDEGDIDVLESCEAISDGWDRQAVEMGIDLRPMRSRPAWIQKVGRVKRVCPMSGKERSLWLDFAGNYRRWGALEWIEGWRELPKGRKPREKRSFEPTAKTCPNCGEICPSASRTCPSCGYEWEMPAELDVSKFREFIEADSDYLGHVGARIRKIAAIITRLTPWTQQIKRGEKTIISHRVSLRGESHDGKLWAGNAPYREDLRTGRIQLSGTVVEHVKRDGRPCTALRNMRLEA